MILRLELPPPLMLGPACRRLGSPRFALSGKLTCRTRPRPLDSVGRRRLLCAACAGPSEQGPYLDDVGIGKAHSTRQFSPLRETEAAQFCWTSAISHSRELHGALCEAVHHALARWPTAVSQPQLALVFVSATASYQQDYGRLLPALRDRLPTLQHVLGCSGAGVVGMGQGGLPEDAQARPALSVVLASLPEVALRTFHAPAAGLPGADAAPEAWHSLIGVPPGGASDHTSLLLLGDAAYAGGDLGALLEGLDYAYPTAAKAGGLNSGGSQQRALWQWSAGEEAQGSPGGLHASGCVGLALQGPLVMEGFVAGGCRPLGSRVFRVTKAHWDVVIELEEEVEEEGAGAGAGEEAQAEPRRVTPLAAVKRELGELPPEQRDRVARQVLVGLAPGSFKPSGELRPGDLLARPVRGADSGSGAVLLGGGEVRVGQRLQLMVRSREGATQSLTSCVVEHKKRSLEALVADAPLPDPIGCLIFAGEGRGAGLHPEPHCDSRTVAEYVPVPSAGFFGSGEIAPAGGLSRATMLHGFTCSAAIFRPAHTEQRWQLPQEWRHQHQRQQRKEDKDGNKRGNSRWPGQQEQE